MGFDCEVPPLQTFSCRYLSSAGAQGRSILLPTSHQPQPRTFPSTALVFSCVDEGRARRAAQDLGGYLLLCFDFSYRSSLFSPMAFPFVPRDFFPVGLCWPNLQVTSCPGNIARAATKAAPPQAVPLCPCGETGRTGKGNCNFWCFPFLQCLFYYFPPILLCPFQQDTDPVSWTVMLSFLWFP